MIDQRVPLPKTCGCVSMLIDMSAVAQTVVPVGRAGVARFAGPRVEREHERDDDGDGQGTEIVIFHVSENPHGAQVFTLKA
jgi:hypothetical protein